MKKTLSIVLSLIMMLTMLPTFAISSFADESNYNIGLSTPTDLIWVYNYTDKSVTISGKHESVMRNYEATFSPLGDEVSIMEDNKLILGLVETANISCAQNVGNYFFYNCTNLTTVNFNDDDCTLIGVGAFGNCTKLSNVTFGNSITTIGESAFHYCSKLTDVTLPNSLTTIGNYAFKDTGIKALNVPASVTTIGEDAFYGIDTVYYSGTAKGAPWGAKNVVDLSWSISSGTLTLAGKGAMPDWNHSTNPAPWYSQRSKINSVVIGEGITTIGTEAFYNFINSASVTIPSTVTLIKDSAFRNNYELSSVTLPNGLTKIGNQAFFNSKLSSIVFPASLIEIGSEAFGASKIKEYYVPCTVAVIGDSAFAGADTVYYSGTATDVDNWGAKETLANPGHYTAATCTTPAVCEICNVTFSGPLSHSYTVVKAAQINPTCGKAGKKAVMKCANCDATTGGATIPATGKHTYKAVLTKKPTSKATGVLTYTCSGCGAKYTKSVAKVATAKLGKLASKKKAQLTVKWTKKSCTGYQVQVATNSKFTKNKKTVTITKANTVSTTIKKLKAGKKYYVRIRCYKTVNGTKCYGSWTKAKTITVKK